MSGKAGSGKVVARLDPLLDKLPETTRTQLWRAVASGGLGNGDTARAIQSLLAGKINGVRHDHVRRLFLTLWDRLMVRDPMLAGVAGQAPGLIQFYDFSALWESLLQHAGADELREEASAIQRWMEQHSADTPIDELIRSEPAKVARRNLAARAAELLASLLERSTSEQRSFMSVINALRQAFMERDQQSDLALSCRPLRHEDLQYFAAAVEAACRLGHPMEPLELPADGKVDETVTVGVSALDTVLGGRIAGHDVCLWPLGAAFFQGYGSELLTANVTELPEQMQLRLRGLLPPVAAVGCAFIEQALERNLTVLGRDRQAAIHFPGPVRRAMADWTRQLHFLVLAIEQLRAGAEAASRELNESLSRISVVLMPETLAAIDRRVDLLDVEVATAGDIDDMLWFGRLSPYIKRLRTPRRRPLDMMGTDETRIVESVETVVRRLDTHPAAEAVYFEAMARLAALQTTFGGQSSRVVNLTNKRLLRSAISMMDRPRGISALGLDLLHEMLALAEAERHDSRNWRDPLLIQLGSTAGSLQLEGSLPRRAVPPDPLSSRPFR